MSSITESKPLQVESETLMTTPLGLTVYPDVALAFSQPPTEQMLTELQQDTPSDTIKASFQTASAFLQTLYSETSDLVLKALHKSQATEKKLSSLDQPASETSMDAIHAHYTKGAHANIIAAQTGYSQLRELQAKVHAGDDGVTKLPCTFCGQLDSASALTDFHILTTLKDLADKTTVPEDQTMLKQLTEKLEADFHKNSHTKPTRIAQIKRLLTRAIHHKLTDFIPVEGEEETHHEVQLDFQLRLDRQIWLLRALMQQNIFLRDFSIIRALHELFPQHHIQVKRSYELVKAVISPLFVKEMTDQHQKLEALTKQMVHLYENVHQLKKQAVETLVNIKTIDSRMPEYIAEMNRLWAGLEYARQHSALTTSLKPRPVEGL